MKLPNRYGTVTKLSGNRRKPWIVKEGTSGKQRPIGYAATKEEALNILAKFNDSPWDIDTAKLTLQELFDLWKEKRAPKLGDSNKQSLISAFNHCAALAKWPYKAIKACQMQDTIDSCGRGYSTQGAIKNLWGHLDKFAFEMEIINRRNSEMLTAAPIPPTTRQIFTDEEVARLWENQALPWVDSVLIFLYSGWRISELLALAPGDIDMEKGTMKGGTKTKAGKGRIVPIHSKIRPFIEKRLADGGSRLISYEGKPVSTTQYRIYWADIMGTLKMEHVPHECRHTFESRLDSAGGNRRCIDLLMGHVSKDTGNRVYNHKTIDQLRETVELIKN